MALGAGVVVLEEPERIPSEEEILEYAEFLGIDVEKEQDLMWIAREGVSAPVPTPWKACTENGDDVFYFNFDTAESVWDHPCDEKYRALVEKQREAAQVKGPAKPTEQPERELSPAALPESTLSLEVTTQDASDDSPSSSGDDEADSRARKGNTSHVPPKLELAPSKDMGGGNEIQKKGLTRQAAVLPRDKEDLDHPSMNDATPRLSLIRAEISEDSLSEGSAADNLTSLKSDVTNGCQTKAPERTDKGPTQIVGRKYIGDSLRLRNRERGVRAKERQHGVDHPEVAQMLHRLADHHRKSGDLTEQRKVLQRALKIHETESGMGNVKLADVFETLIGVHRELGEHEEQRQLLARRDSLLSDSGIRGSSAPQQAERASPDRRADHGLVGIGISPDRREDHGLAGVGISPAGCKAGVAMERDELLDTSDTPSSPSSYGHNGKRGNPDTWSKPTATGLLRPTAAHLELQLEQSGQSCLSELSEDFPSAFESSSPRQWQHGVDLGDTLELSATMLTENGEFGESVANGASAGDTRLHQDHPSRSSETRWEQVEAEVESLSRCLAIFRDIREKQLEYARLLEAGM